MRVLLLEIIEQMFSLIRNEINYLSLPANEIFDKLSEIDEIKKLKFISCCSEAISKGEDFRVAWKNSLEIKANTSYLRPKDIHLLNTFGESFGVTDSEGQISNCDMYMEILKSNRKEAVAVRDRYSKTATLLGLLSGLGLLIVFL